MLQLLQDSNAAQKEQNYWALWGVILHMYLYTLEEKLQTRGLKQEGTAPSSVT